MWTCPTCGMTINSDLAPCWNCKNKTQDQSVTASSGGTAAKPAPAIEPLQKTDNKVPVLCTISAGALVISFFLPWVQGGPLAVSGFQIAQLGKYFGLLWAIPLLGAITALLDLNGRDEKALRGITGACPWVMFIYAMSESGKLIPVEAIGVGLYATLAAATVLCIYELRRKSQK